MSYTDRFTDTSVPPSGASFGAVTMTANATFAWSYSYSGALNVISKIMEISCAAGNVMTLPSAKEVSRGEDFLVRNVGGQTLTIHDNAGGTIGTVAAGAVLAVYLKDNSTVAGTWGTVTYGVGTSSVDAATLAGAGLYPIASTLNQEFAVYGAASGFNITTTHRAQLVNYTGGAGTITFAASATLLDGFFVLIRNSGTGTLTLNPDGTELIDGATTLIIQPGESAIVGCSGTALFTVGLGRSTTYQFTQLTKDLTTCSAPSCVSNTTTLTSIEASNKLLTFLGSPAVAQIVEVPDVVAVYYVYNNLSTAHSVTVKTASGAGSDVTQSGRAILFCDGTNVFAAQTVAVTSALAMESGSVTNPGLYFASETNTGFYRPSANQLGISVAGAMSAIFGTSGLITTAAGNLTSTTLNAALNELQLDIDSRATTAAITSAVSSHAGLTATHGIAGAIVGTTDTQTLTQKTINLTSNTLVATSLQLKTAMTDETGSGSLVFATSPTLVTPILGTPTSGDLSNCTGFPALSIPNDHVTYAKIQNVSATDKILGRVTAGAGDIEEIACTAAGRALLDDLDAAAQRSTLGLGTLAVASNVNDSNWSGTDLSVANGGTGASTLTGLVKGNGTSAFTAAVAGTDYLAPGAIGSTVQAYDADLAAISGLVKTANYFMVANGTNWTAKTPAEAVTALGITGGTSGRHTIWIPAVAMTPRLTDGAIGASTETTTYHGMVRTLNFVHTVDTYAQFVIRMPTSWNESTYTAYFVLSADAVDATSQTVWMSIAGVAIGNTEVLDVQMGIAELVTTTFASTDANKLKMSIETDPMTADGAISAGDLVRFEVSRNVSDSLPYTVRLHGVALIYTTDADVDAA